MLKSFYSVVFLVMALVVNVPVNAQTAGVYATKNDSLMEVLMKKHISINEAKQTMPGYRIQIYFGNDRLKANDMRGQFMSKFAGQQAYLLYHQPNFKVRVGDFKTHLEAFKFQQDMNGRFPNSYIVKDEVKLPVVE